MAKLDESYRPIPSLPTHDRSFQPYRGHVNFLFRGLNMKAQLRNHVAALFLLAPVAGALTALPTVAMAQAGSPEVSSLQVTSDHGLAPGSRLHFRLEGTPRAKASIRIRGAQAMIPLAERSPGVYVGRYVIARSDNIQEGDAVRAIMRRGNRTVTASYEVPAGLGNVAAAPSAPPPPLPLRIERFQVAALDRIQPGVEIRFTLEGVPGAAVSVDLPGMANDVALRETRPGHYEGSYTVRRADTINTAGPVVATLRMGDRAVTMNLAQPLVAADTRPPQLTNVSPREGETLPGAAATTISGNFNDRGGTGVDPRSVRIVISGRNVTDDAHVTPESFSLRTPLPPGRHTVDVQARDNAGNAIRRSWSFDIASGPATVPIQILSHVNNGQVDGNVTHVRGRTAPNAVVQVRVDAIPPMVGQFGVARNVFSRAVEADSNGHFEFSFVSPFPLPGARYDVAMTANKADVTTEAKLVLFQRQG
jgi:hypothetical protein